MDNDGRRDMLMINGHVYPEVDKTPGYQVPPAPAVLLECGRRKVQGNIEAGRPGLSARLSSRGAVGDLEDDGSLEVVVSNMGARPSLLKNTDPIKLAARAARGGEVQQRCDWRARRGPGGGPSALGRSAERKQLHLSERQPDSRRPGKERDCTIGLRSSGRGERASSSPEERPTAS